MIIDIEIVEDLNLKKAHAVHVHIFMYTFNTYAIQSNINSLKIFFILLDDDIFVYVMLAYITLQNLANTLRKYVNEIAGFMLLSACKPRVSHIKGFLSFYYLVKKSPSTQAAAEKKTFRSSISLFLVACCSSHSGSHSNSSPPKKLSKKKKESLKHRKRRCILCCTYNQ